MSHQSIITRDWIASRTDLFGELFTAVDELVHQNPNIALEETLRTLPEGQQAAWHVGRFFQDLASGGFAPFFRTSIEGDPTGRRFVSAYIAFNRLGLLPFATLLARGAAVSLDFDADLQAPSRNRKPLTVEQYDKAVAKLNREFQSLGSDWRKHIERFIRTQPRLFTEVTATTNRKRPRG
ncbi:MAG: hypothetical protein NT069_28595 [Planctomycetota bacterium]|nr:hypothetical protein [Planctomycetota bacterium]